MDLKQNEWHEREDLKPISQMLRKVAPRDSPFDPIADDAPPKHDSGIQELRLLDPEHLSSSDCRNLVCRIASTSDSK